MKKDRKIEADKIHILAIKTLKGNIDCPPDADVNAVFGHDFEFELYTGLNTGDKLVGFKLVVNIKAKNKKEKVLLMTGSYTHEMIFMIDNLDDFIEKNEDHDKLDLGLGSTLVGIIYSTVRGIIYSRTQGTSLGVVTLPVIAPLKLMQIEPIEEGQIGRLTKQNKESLKKADKKRRKADKTN